MKARIPLLRILIASLSLLTIGPAFTQGNPSAATCGLPLGGYFSESATYHLSADCDLQSTLGVGHPGAPGHPPRQATITINGNGHTIKSSSGGFLILFHIYHFSHLILNNVKLDGSGTNESLVLAGATDASLTANNVTFANSVGGAIGTRDRATVHLTNVRFEGNGSGVLPRYGSAIHLATPSTLLLTNAVFRNHHGGNGAVVFEADAMATAAGCLTFQNNSPRDIYHISPTSTFTDNSTGPCPSSVGAGGSFDGSPSDGGTVIEPGEQRIGRFHDLGAIGTLFRFLEPELTIEVWEILPENAGRHLLSVTQSQINAVKSAGLVSRSADRRVAVRVGEDRNITISMGPDNDGEVHHATFYRRLGGAIIQTSSTSGGPPGASP